MAEKVDLRGVKDDEGQNVLHAAARMGHLEVCKFLVDELGLHVNSTSAERSCAVIF
jgi:ankyrin repeat protein